VGHRLRSAASTGRSHGQHTSRWRRRALLVPGRRWPAPQSHGASAARDRRWTTGPGRPLGRRSSASGPEQLGHDADHSGEAMPARQAVNRTRGRPDQTGAVPNVRQRDAPTCVSGIDSSKPVPLHRCSAPVVRELLARRRAMSAASSFVESGSMPPCRHDERDEENEVDDDRKLSNGICRRSSASCSEPTYQG
jgi:hypothetical protein